jgi:hypothetical protein
MVLNLKGTGILVSRVQSVMSLMALRASVAERDRLGLILLRHRWPHERLSKFSTLHVLYIRGGGGLSVCVSGEEVYSVTE